MKKLVIVLALMLMVGCQATPVKVSDGSNELSELEKLTSYGCVIKSYEVYTRSGITKISCYGIGQ